MVKLIVHSGIQMANILITGGTGSFGKAFVKKCLSESFYDKIIVYSRDEHKQERMADELKSDRLRFFLGDVRDRDRLKLAVQDCMYVVHAAALKVVPAGEYNPMEFVKTNILGAQNIVDTLVSERNRFARVIALSTDKAVNPINLYGYTKGCMEKILLASNNLVAETADIRFSIVRYGNVANSAGSVIPKFKQRWLRNESVPITDTRMTRFWIELDEAANFVYSKLNPSMPAGKVFIPEMPSFNILDLVRAFNNGSAGGYSTIGIRPGEKLHEQIDETKHSNTNERFLTWQELREKLISLNVLHT